MAQSDASKTAELLAQGGLVQPDLVSAATKLLESIEKLKEVSFLSTPNAINTIHSLANVAAEARAVLQTGELSQIMMGIGGLAIISAYQERIGEMNKKIAHLNDMAGSISDLLSQACGALDAAVRVKQSLIAKIQSIKQEIEGNLHTR